MRRESALVVMLKYPEPGKVKTRLVPPLTEHEAADLYRCFVEDTFSRLQPLSRTGAPGGPVRIYGAFTPAERREAVAALLPAGTPLISQRGRDLGERLSTIFDGIIDSHYEMVVIIGSDSPDIPLAYIQDALGLLNEKRGRVVLGPSEDGGYYLIAMDSPHTIPFERVSWGSDTVLNETIEGCRRGGIEVVLLPTWRDVDRVEDLEPLINNSRLPATSRFINKNLGHIIGIADSIGVKGGIDLKHEGRGG